MNTDNVGNPIPIGFSSKADSLRVREGARHANRIRMSPDKKSFTSNSTSTKCVVRVTGDKITAAGGFPGVFTYRNLESGSPSEDWIDGEDCIVFDINDADLTTDQRYDGEVYDIKEWTSAEDGDHFSMYVRVDSLGIDSVDGIQTGCAWLSNVPKDTCLSMRLMGWGQFADMMETLAEAVKAIYHPSEDGWIPVKMKDTCCGCGATIFQITDPDNLEAVIHFRSIHISCIAGTGGEELAQITMKLENCGRDPITKEPYAVFWSSSAKACNGATLPCENVFRLIVKCTDCPPTACQCHCSVESPFAWMANFDPPVFADMDKNGFWIWTLNEDEQCEWNAYCEPTDTTSDLMFVQADDLWRLTHGGTVYELNDDDWLPQGPNTLNKVSGEGPATVTLIALIRRSSTGDPMDELAQCIPPADVFLELDLPLGGEQDGIGIIVHQDDPDILVWSYGPVNGLSASLTCDNGKWIAIITGVCSGDGLTPWAFAQTGRPISASYDPLEIVWNGVINSPGPGGCSDGAAATVVATAA